MEFFSNHPNPGQPHRQREQGNCIARRLAAGYQSDSSEFQDIKRYVRSLPAPPGKGTTQSLQGDPGSDDGRTSTPPSAIEPSEDFSELRIADRLPRQLANLRARRRRNHHTRGGLVNDGKGNQALAYGVIINIFEPHSLTNQYSQRLQDRRLRAAGFRHFRRLPGTGHRPVGRRTPPGQPKDARDPATTRASSRMDSPLESTYLSNDSPVAGGGRETNWLITLQRPEGLLFIVFVAPEREFQGYESTFQQMLNSVRVQSGNSPSYSSSGNDQSYSGPGRMTWRGRVDAYVEGTMQDNRVRSIERQGAPTVNEQVNFSSPLPIADVRVSVKKLNGRGEVLSFSNQPI